MQETYISFDSSKIVQAKIKKKIACQFKPEFLEICFRFSGMKNFVIYSSFNPISKNHLGKLNANWIVHNIVSYVAGLKEVVISSFPLTYIFFKRITTGKLYSLT